MHKQHLSIDKMEPVSALSKQVGLESTMMMQRGSMTTQVMQHEIIGTTAKVWLGLA